MSFARLADNLARVREDIAAVQAAEGLSVEVRIVAVTKGHPPEAVVAAVRAGVADVGENRVQEALAKQAEVGQGAARWHLIGHLQTNKARSVPGRFALVHSVDSIRVVDALGAAAARAGSVVPVLVQVNVAREPQKSGCAPEEAAAVVERAAAVPGLEVVGFMTMAPFEADERAQRRVFGDLRRLRDALRAPGRPLPELSMGMSGDYRAAVAEGATMLRLGTVLFGERPQ
ncbi:MAG TPA: YggS family pyridoxal phosphate-dependent enzyme [Gemmatimonadales bacterium]|nr:YggS family pyridoxal phosphate-dependent enzyme [Gemmatimonadales bacterium]